MAFRRRTSRKTYRRRRVGKSLSRKVARVTSTVRKITHQVLEKKVVDTTVAMTTIYTPDSAVISGVYRVLPFNISQGDSISQRQGQKILAKYIKMCYTFQHAHTISANTCNRIRIMVVMDKMPQSSGGTVPTYGDIVQFTSTPAQWPLTPPDVNQGFVNRRFKFLYDKVHDLTEFNSVGNTYPTNESQCYRKVTIPVNKVITFNSSSGTSLGRNHIYVFCWSDQVYDGVLVPPIGSVFTRAVYLDN